ncbi:hypothetical protein SDC9_195066 [bioreactor metagenome]|uniref:Uncharacterized protein n=1 Tax=bioreactor metagenome TaxID=1076179 RepID=A0A645IGM9_9ZZZZ
MCNNLVTTTDGFPNGVGINETAQTLVDTLAQADIELDNDKRITEYQQAQDLLADLAGNIPLYFEAEHIIYRSNIGGTADYALPETLNIGANIFFNYSLITKQ